jgi:chemotaxis protein methyltransferase CheR
VKPATLTDAEFHALVQLLHDSAGLVFDAARRESLGYSVAERMQAVGIGDVATYLVNLRGAPAERQKLIDEVTIPETHFFRNPPQIRALRQHVLPELMRQAAETKRLRVWSAGCSTGEEPYTIAMLLQELLPASAGWDVRVIATDISTRALEAAQQASYAERSFVMTDPVDRERFFVRDAETDRYRVRPEVRELVEFRHHNLVNDHAPFAAGQADLVLCRNVTIYFDRSTTKRLMLRFHQTLRDGGYLFLGHSETLWQVTDQFALVTLGDAFVYRRPPVGADRRHVLPDRRTEDEPRPTRPDRRRGAADRRKQSAQRQAADRSGSASPVRRPAAGPDPLVAARDCVAHGRYDEAERLAAEVADATPLRGDAHYLRGLALANLGRDKDALVALRKAAYLDPGNGFVHFLLGGALERSGEQIAAARCYRAAAHTLGRRPGDVVAPELGGRSVAELAALCRQLADRTDLAVPERAP